MPRYEFTEGSSSKFWEVVLDGSSVTTRYGRIGAAGQESTKAFGSEVEAKRALDKLVAEKVKKGYQLVPDAVVAAPGAAPARPGPKPRAAAAPASADDATGEGLLAVLRERPDDAGAYAVYADWLLARGDAHARLVLLALRDPRAAERYVYPHWDELMGARLPSNKANLRLAWKFGFIRAAWLAARDPDDEVPAWIRALVAHPAARLLRSLTVAEPNADDDVDYARVIAALAKGVPASLAELYLGDFGDAQLSWSRLGDLSKAYPALARLRSLKLRAGDMSLGRIDLPDLRRFEVITGGLSSGNARAVANARWPELEELVVYLGSASHGASLAVRDLLPVLDAAGLPKLMSLALCNSDQQDAVARAVASSRVLRQLRRLDLSKGTMTDEGARAILERAADFAHLEALDVSENYLSEGAATQLAAVCRGVDAGRQRSGEYRYTVVAE